jgi:cytochrome c oxidase assembly protein subunit 15
VLEASISRGGGRPPRSVIVWLAVCAAMIFVMAVIGAITRLTESGLSIVDWAPITGIVPPLSLEEWNRAFEAYRNTPQYIIDNSSMTLEGFQHIYFWEWFHRLWGRLIGVAFAIGLVWFSWRGRLSPELRVRLLIILVLGGLQGAVGWIMVQSGLVDGMTSVSHYRLAAHLALAVLLYAMVLWTLYGLTIRRKQRPSTLGWSVRGHAWLAVAMVATTMCWGAFVAGLKAGLMHNTFPLMDGHLLPPGAWTLNPAWLNAFDNGTLVQFIHRTLAISTGLVVLLLGWRVRGSVIRGLGGAVAGMVLLQIGLGADTVLNAVPVSLGAIHQAGALVLLGLLLALAARLARTTRGVAAWEIRA